MYKIALALFPFVEDLKKDLKETLLKIKSMGYEGVEFAFGLYYNPNYLRKVLDEVGLEIVGWHIDYRYTEEDLFEAIVNYMSVVGNKRLIVPGLPKDMIETKEAWDETSKKFNCIAKRLKKYGISLGYHNHQQEFIRIGEGYRFDTFCQNTKDSVFLQLDVGNMLSAGADPNSFFKKYGPRFETVHLKPYSLEKGFCTMIGDDSINYKDIIKNIKEYGIEWLIIEYEVLERYERYEGVNLCIQRIKNIITECQREENYEE